MSSKQNELKTVLITGGTGLLGKVLTKLLQDDGYKIRYLSRSKQQIKDVEVFQWNPSKGEIELGALENLHGLIHLAGANVGEKAWTDKQRKRILDSRLDSTKLLVEQHNSKLPKTIKEIKKLPGIGDYTANALLGLIHDQPRIAVDGNVKRVFARILNKKEERIDFDKLILLNKKKLFNTNRNADFVEALMEFGAMICKPKDPICSVCCLNKSCKYFKSSYKIITTNKKKIKEMNYDIFCYLNKKKQIALTKENKISFLKNFNLPTIKKMKNISENKNWKFLKSYKNCISNLKLNINLYYKFSNKIPSNYNWYLLKNNKEFIPSFTKKIFKQVSILFQ